MTACGDRRVDHHTALVDDEVARKSAKAEAHAHEGERRHGEQEENPPIDFITALRLLSGS